jgi:hypothetical protein
MKINLLILIVLFTSVVKGQDSLPSLNIKRAGVSKPYSEKMAKMIELLDKRKIKTGILADKALLLVSMDEFNGKVAKIISVGEWKQIYRQLFNASVEKPQIIHPDTLKSITLSLIRQEVRATASKI